MESVAVLVAAVEMYLYGMPSHREPDVSVEITPSDEFRDAEAIVTKSSSVATGS